MHNFQDNINIFRRGFIDTPFSNEPTFLTFSIEIDFDSIFDQSTGMSTSPFFDLYTSNGAYQYLMGRGYKKEANNLIGFRDKLKQLIDTQPWFFQSVSGLNELWRENTDMKKAYKGADKKITIETLESLNLSITHIADLYREIAYDAKYRRELLPDNLRYFSCSIYVAEFRNLHISERDKVNKLNLELDEFNTPNSYYSDVQYNFFDVYKHHMKFNCTMCEFDFSESVPFDNLTVIKPEMSKNKFSIKPQFFNEDNSYGLDNTVLDDVNLIKRNAWEHPDIKMGLNEILYGARRTSDIYNGLKTGDLPRHALNNNPLSNSVKNAKYNVETSASYIKSNL